METIPSPLLDRLEVLQLPGYSEEEKTHIAQKYIIPKQLDLHGLQLNITTIIAAQNHQQHYGIEHIAVNTDDYPGTLAKLKANGVTILEELPPNNGRRVCFLQAPDGAQMEVIEKV